MVYFFYKCYYVFFLHFSRSKMEVPWFSAITVITLAVALVLMVFYFVFADLFGLTGTFFDVESVQHSTPLARKGRQFLFVIPYITGIWYAIKYILLNMAKASKETGRSEIYVFEPTKRDKVVTWVFYITACSLIFIAVGIRYLLGHYDK